MAVLRISARYEGELQRAPKRAELGDLAGRRGRCGGAGLAVQGAVIGVVALSTGEDVLLVATFTTCTLALSSACRNAET